MPVRTHACRALAACLILAALALPRTLPAAQASPPLPVPAAPQRGDAGFALCGGLSVAPGPGEPWPGDKALRPGESLSPADKGLGCRFVPPGKAGGAPLFLEARLTRPSGTDGAPVVDRWFVPARRGEPAAVTYAFFPPGAAAPGAWQLELFDGDAPVASQTFVMPEPAATGADTDAAPFAVRAAIGVAAAAQPQQAAPELAPTAAATPDVTAAATSDAGEQAQTEPAPEAAPEAMPAPVAPPPPPASAKALAPRAAAPDQAATPQAPAIAQKAPASAAPSEAPQKTSAAGKTVASPVPKAGSPVPATPKPAAVAAKEPAGKGKGKDAPKGFVALQTGLFADAANAQGQAAKLRGRGIPACLVEEGQGKTKRYRVLAGRYGERRAALAARNEVRAAAGVSPLLFEVAPGVAAGLRCH
ncbi:SPOR domain-containing protein [Solidesulfovibrio alcoholivorans]|uniref:SPOR domain-containing protein n=1 Tax=Solidesulfovibrio alcoholivorans TaxID=81406 RepID=UPI0005C1F3FA|nr:SPOR domain-containing protein [Solidesulfovibrio alcoholivorans]